jgi:PIN domain nuclease of toxin-antitoxin system
MPFRSWALAGKMRVTRRSHQVSCIPDRAGPDSVRDLQRLRLGIQQREGFRASSHSRLYTKSCSRITTFWELTTRKNKRKLKPRVSGQQDQPPTEISLQVGQMPLLTEERIMRQSLPRLRVTSSPSARLGAATASSCRMKCLTGCSHYSPSRPEFQNLYLENLSPEIAPDTESRP